MTAVWQIPVATLADRTTTIPRRLHRALEPYPLPRDARPSRARRERLPEVLRTWGAVSGKRA